MKKQLLVIITCIAGISVLCAADASKKLRVGVLDFKGQGASSSEAFAVSELFRGELVDTDRYDVLDRNNMNEVMKEQALQQTGCTETACAVQIGKILNMEYMLYGVLLRVGGDTYISASMLQVESSRIVKSSRVRVADMKKLDESVRTVVEEITGITQKKKTSALTKAGFGVLSIASSPSDADVFIDGKNMGKTKFMQEISRGRHAIKIVKEGYFTKEFFEEIEDGQTREVNAFLEKGISLEEALQKREASFSGMLWRGGFAVGAAGLTALGIVLGGYFEQQGITRFADYNNAYDTPTATRIGDEYEALYNTADLWFYAAETGIVLTAAFITWGVFDFLAYNSYGEIAKRLEKETGKKKVSLMMLPTISPTAVGMQCTLRF